MSRLFLLRPQAADEPAPATESANAESLRTGAWTDDFFDAITNRLSGWTGDEILASIRGTVVTADLALRLAEADVTGMRLSEVVYAEQQQGGQKTVYTRIVPLGFVLVDDDYRIQSWSGHDICASPKSELVVSEKALAIMREAKLANCGVTQLGGEI